MKEQVTTLEKDIDGLLMQYDLACKDKDERLMDEIGEEIYALLQNFSKDIINVSLPKDLTINMVQ